MANNLKLSTAVRSSMMTALNTAIGTSCQWRIYSGTQPAGPDSTATGTLLAELTGNVASFGSVTSGVLTATLPITQDSSANATNTAGYFRILTSGSVAVIDGEVGVTGADLNLNSTSITAGAIVQISAATFTAGNA